MVNVCSPAAGVKLNVIVLPVITAVGAPIGGSVEEIEGQEIVLRKSAPVPEQVVVHPASVVDPAPGEITIVDGLRVREMLLGTEVTGVTVQGTMILPKHSKV